jgi:hypothetical protein
MEKKVGFEFIEMAADDGAQITVLKSQHNRLVSKLKREGYYSEEIREWMIQELRLIKAQIDNYE